MQPVKPAFLGLEEPPATRIADVQTLLPHHRHRGGRQHRPAPHLLRDARQLELRRLLQTGVDPVGLGALGRGFRVRPRADLGHRVRGRRGARRRAGSGGDRDLELSGMPDERIVQLSRSENFWQAGPTGPCGPCTELYFDRGEEFGDRGPAGRRHRSLHRVWNHVFMSYELSADGASPLPSATSTPAWASTGWRRCCRRALGLRDRPVLAADRTGRGAVGPLLRPGRGDDTGHEDPGDDSRGAAPDRRRRRPLERGSRLYPAADHAPRDPAGPLVGLESPFLARFADATIELMGETTPSWRRAGDDRPWISDEEESFGRTLERGTELLETDRPGTGRRAPPGSMPRRRSSCTTPSASRTT